MSSQAVESHHSDEISRVYNRSHVRYIVKALLRSRLTSTTPLLVLDMRDRTIVVSSYSSRLWSRAHLFGVDNHRVLLSRLRRGLVDDLCELLHWKKTVVSEVSRKMYVSK